MGRLAGARQASFDGDTDPVLMLFRGLAPTLPETSPWWAVQERCRAGFFSPSGGLLSRLRNLDIVFLIAFAIIIRISIIMIVVVIRIIIMT